MPPAQPASPEDVQRRIRRYRERLLTGRGPGASPQETAPYMRDRQRLGGIPAAVARQQEADRAALAAADPSAVEDVLIRQRAQLAVTLTTVTGRLRTLRARAVLGLRAGLIATAAVAAAALAGQATLRGLTRYTPRSLRPPAGSNRSNSRGKGRTAPATGRQIRRRE